MSVSVLRSTRSSNGWSRRTMRCSESCCRRKSRARLTWFCRSMKSGHSRDVKLRWSGMKTRWLEGTPLNNKRDKMSLLRLRLKRKRLEIRYFRNSKRKMNSAALRKSSKNTSETSYLLRSRKLQRELRSVQMLKSVSELERSSRLQKISRWSWRLSVLRRSNEWRMNLNENWWRSLLRMRD